jgi:hypothetical protein
MLSPPWAHVHLRQIVLAQALSRMQQQNCLTVRNKTNIVQLPYDEEQFVM